jgi:murein DD-endopeptidase MepM/ murein hydrolase activator NlpD
MMFTAMWRTALAAAVMALAPGLAGPGGGADPGRAGCGGGWCWPVTGPGPRGRPEVLRAFVPPATPWSAGHRGVDLRAGPSAPVRAAAAGEIAFAGRVAGTDVVVVRHAAGLRTTYEPVRATLPVGTPVAAGGQVGLLTGPLAHCTAPCLHWGLLRATAYLDPLTLLPPSLLTAGRSRLLPVYGDTGGGGGGVNTSSGWRRRAGPW